MKKGLALFPQAVWAIACLAVCLSPAAAFEAGDKKPEPADNKADDKKPALQGTIKALADDGKRFTLLPAPTKKDTPPAAIEIRVGERTRITSGKEAGQLAVGQLVTVTLEDGVAAEVQIGKLPGKSDKPVKPAVPEVKQPPKPASDATQTKLAEPRKAREPARPPRDPAPTVAVIDTEVDRRLAEIKVPASPQADDAEFLRRVFLDLTGRIPTYQQTVAFLDSTDPDKRSKLIDELLDNPAYGEHFATIWRRLLVPREVTGMAKGSQRESFGPWLAEQFNDNRGWNAIVMDLLTAEGLPASNPATAFLLANGENNQPQPNKITGAAAALFWGVNLRCAECHDHPFTNWKQRDFWGTAAFFGKLRSGGNKGGPATLMELAAADGGAPGKKSEPGAPPAVRGSGIVIPAGSGKSAGQLVNARFLGGDEAALNVQDPFRPTFAAWATSADNPYFARAAVNRLWAHFFGRGFVNPLDNFDESNPPSHPALLDRLAREFASSGFDLKHLARCITRSKAYQRTSRPVPGNEADTAAFSHMAVKVLTPEVLYDALASIGGGGSSAGKGSGEKQEPRDQFLRAFRSDDEVAATDYIQGIPQMLRLMNASSPQRGAAVVDQLGSSGASGVDAVTTLYLTVLSRRPTVDEVELMSGYIAKRKDSREAYRGVLWILLNSSEFALNH